MPHFFATAVSVIPLSRSRTMAARSRFIGARPIRTPSSFALRMPAKTRSRIKSPSSSAIDPMIVRKRRPMGLWSSVLMPSLREMKAIPRLSNSSTTCRKCRVLRATRSNAATSEFVLPCVCHQRVQTRTPRSPARNPTVLIDLDHFKGAPRSKLAQIVKLAFDMLIGCADADIDGCFQRRLS